MFHKTELLVLLVHLLILKDAHTFSISVIPSKERITQIGQELLILCQSNVKLNYCQFDVPRDGSMTLQPNQQEYKGITYHGRGLDKGECGLRLKRVQDYHNGEFKCRLTEYGTVPIFAETIKVIVAVMPAKPTLSITRGREVDAYLEGDSATATCKVERGRPPANITWYLDDEKLTDGLGQLQLTNESSELYSVTQNLTRKILASDNGKSLKCVSGHPLLEFGGNISRQISVRFGPRSLSEPIERFGLVEGEEARVALTIHANPKPTFSWVVTDTEIHEGDTDITGKYYVERSTDKIEKGSGYYETVLVIKNLEKADVEQIYKAKAANKYGEQLYRVVISTHPEPKMLELGVGTIFGIIVAVLVVLTLTSILVFARAKGRWCFAGRGGPHLAGESSDTESADHHGQKKPKMTFKAVFKKSKDKVASEPGPDTKDVTVNDNQEEEGKLNPEAQLSVAKDEGVVYAELDLQRNAQGRSLLVRPEDEKTEYAEIIHTKENKA